MTILGGVMYAKHSGGDSNVLDIVSVLCVALYMLSFSLGKLTLLNTGTLY